MRHWFQRLIMIGSALLLTGCLWGPGKFASNLTLRKDGSFTLDYRGEIVLQLPENAQAKPWTPQMAHCFEDVKGTQGASASSALPQRKERACTEGEIAAQKAAFDQQSAEERKQAEQAVKMFGLPGLDDESNRAFAAKLMKYQGWRSVTYRGHGVFDVDYHLDGRATQDFVFPALPDNDLLMPFVAIRRRSDGSVLVTAPALTGGAGPLMAGLAASGDSKTNMVSHASGRFTIVTDGEILTNNSEDGPAPAAFGREIHWDVGPASKKIPETLIRL